MKSCPVCSRTFDDTLSFCLVDGSVLSAPFDPQATVPSLAAPVTDLSENETLTRVAIPLNAGFQASPAANNQFAPPPTAAAVQKPLTALQVFGMWAQLVSAIIISLVLSCAAAYIVGGFVVIVFDPTKNMMFAVLFMMMFLTFAALLTVTIRWWRRKRRRAGLL